MVVLPGTKIKTMNDVIFELSALMCASGDVYAMFRLLKWLFLVETWFLKIRRK